MKGRKAGTETEETPGGERLSRGAEGGSGKGHLGPEERNFEQKQEGSAGEKQAREVTLQVGGAAGARVQRQGRG